MPIVELPNGSEIEFPEGMSANEIGRVLFENSQPGRMLHRMFNPSFLEPYRAPMREMALDVLPGTGHVRSVNRMEQMLERFKNPQTSTFGKYVTGADMALEGAGLAADVVPALKTAGAAIGTGLSLFPMMSRYGGELTPLQRALRHQLGKITYHGSPHRFAPEPGFPLGRFKHEMMGTGEGAQMYGHGTYLADVPDTAKSYIPRDFDAEDMLMAQYKMAESIDDMTGMEIFERAMLHDTSDEIAEFFDDPDVAPYHNKSDINKALKRLKKIEKQSTGFLYEVDLPDDEIAKMLDWDAPVEFDDPLTQQILEDFPDELDDISEITGAPGSGYEGQPETGGAIYQWLSAKLGGPEQASAYLNDAGYPGIKYFDQHSRDAAEGTRNYVVFDEDIMRIMKRNNEQISR